MYRHSCYMHVCTYVRTLVHKRMSILTFEGLSTTFEASTNVYFTFVIKLYIKVITYALKLPTKYFLIIIKLLGTHVIAFCSA